MQAFSKSGPLCDKSIGALFRVVNLYKAASCIYSSIASI